MPAIHPSEKEAIEIRRGFTERFEQLLAGVALEPPGAGLRALGGRGAG